MRLLRNLSVLALAAAISAPASLSAQPGTLDTQGYLDYRYPVNSGGALAGASVGPYLAGFSNSSLGDAQGGTPFEVFCFDWLSGIRDTKVAVLTLNQASVNAGLISKFAPTAGTGLTLSKLQQAAWLTTEFDATGSNWKSVHHALWSLFVPTAPSTTLPALTVDASAYVAASLAAVNGGFVGEDFRVLLPLINVQGEWVFDASNQVTMTQLPEPGSVFLVVTGLLAMVAVARRKSRGEA
jgi:hypothetical protein